MSFEMAKRKRGDRDERPPADVGLGATLAHMRGEDEPDEATEGWTVVGKRRKQHNSRDSASPSPSPTQDASVVASCKLPVRQRVLSTTRLRAKARSWGLELPLPITPLSHTKLALNSQVRT